MALIGHLQDEVYHGEDEEDGGSDDCRLVYFLFSSSSCFVRHCSSAAEYAGEAAGLFLHQNENDEDY